MASFRIAVLLTSYNAKSFIAQTLEGISSLTRLPDQVLAADDGSTDGTREIIEEWAARQPFEVVVRAKSQGASGSPARGRQWGLENSNADLIALLDHDDLFLPHALSRLEEAFRLEPELVLCFGDARVFETDPAQGKSLLSGKEIGELHMKSQAGFGLCGPDLFLRLLKGSFIPTSSNLWRRDAAVAVGGFDDQIGSADDALLWLRLCKMGAVGCYREFLSCRRLHVNNLSHSDLGSGLSGYRAYVQLLREANTLGLHPAETQAISQTVQELLPGISYHAARAGLPTYRRLSRELGFPLELKRLLVALATSATGSTKG